jgi:hypothetical protein
MSDPLDDFNRRMTAGDAAWVQGPPKNGAESAAQSFIDAQASVGRTPVGGGSIDFGTRVSAIILLVGVVLFAGGAYALDNLREGAAMAGIVVLIVSGFLLLIGGGGLAIACVRQLGSARGWRNLLLAVFAALAAWWFSPWLWMMSNALIPRELLPLAAAALVLALLG